MPLTLEGDVTPGTATFDNWYLIPLAFEQAVVQQGNLSYFSVYQSGFPSHHSE